MPDPKMRVLAQQRYWVLTSDPTTTIEEASDLPGLLMHQCLGTVLPAAADLITSKYLQRKLLHKFCLATWKPSFTTLSSALSGLVLARGGPILPMLALVGEHTKYFGKIQISFHLWIYEFWDLIFEFKSVLRAHRQPSTPWLA